MSIQYILTESKLATVPEGFLARVQSQGTADLDAIIERIIERDTTVGRVDVLGVIEAFFSAVECFVQEGKNVVTPLVNLRPSVRGIFDDEMDGFDPARHRVVLSAVPGRRFRQALRDVPVVKVDGDEPEPKPKRFLDLVTGEKNGTISPGSMGRLTGRWLKFDADDPEQGAFFLASDGTGTRVDVVGWNKPAMLMFDIPSLSPGTYTLQVRSRFNGSDELRSGTLKAPLTVSG